jgi:hypothetical protein
MKAKSIENMQKHEMKTANHKKPWNRGDGTEIRGTFNFVSNKHRIISSLSNWMIGGEASTLVNLS